MCASCDLFIYTLVKVGNRYHNKSSNTKKHTLNMRTIIKLKKNDVSCVPKRHTNLYQQYIIFHNVYNNINEKKSSNNYVTLDT